jgi:hypothetical protein
MTKFSSTGLIIGATETMKPNSYMVDPVNQTADFDPEKLFDHIEEQQDNDWRK